jgi:hypothetical protein
MVWSPPNEVRGDKTQFAQRTAPRKRAAESARACEENAPLNSMQPFGHCFTLDRNSFVMQKSTSTPKLSKEFEHVEALPGNFVVLNRQVDNECLRMRIRIAAGFGFHEGRDGTAYALKGFGIASLVDF